ncbi:MAG TPA: hypothetical protein VMX14_04640 [Anaerolineae bacterium]|nr:hypothetical protein [Anaerolineae bacterium]
MEFWKEPWFKEVVRQVVIALLVALLSVLGYDSTVARPRLRTTIQQSIQSGAGR